MRPGKGLSRRARFTRGVLIAARLLALLTCLDYAFYPYGTSLPGETGNQGENGIWLRYTWYFGRHSAGDEKELAARLRENQMRYAYAHVRYIRKDGHLHFHYPDEAQNLVAALHRDDPGVQVLAWIYADGGHSGRDGSVNLADPAVRRAMVSEAHWLTTTCGFDGVQWDYEVCPDSDMGLLALLRETRAALPAGKRLGVATPLWAPTPFLRYGLGWGENYFAQIAATCDQIAVMDYDSGVYLPRAYVAMTAAQVRHVCAAASQGNPNCRVLIGVPTYIAGGPSHNAHAENIGLALRGVRAGLEDLSPSERATFAGVAPFADYTTTPADWQAYRNDWLTR